MNPSNWLVLEKYPFTLLPGTAKPVDGKAQSYYEYLNERPHETGKNILCTEFLCEGVSKGGVVVEPFGGCGAFAVALQHLLEPKRHVITEIDEECVTQLEHVMDSYPTMEVYLSDATESIGQVAADVYVLDFPFFTYHHSIVTGKRTPRLSQ